MSVRNVQLTSTVKTTKSSKNNKKNWEDALVKQPTRSSGSSGSNNNNNNAVGVGTTAAVNGSASSNSAGVNDSFSGGSGSGSSHCGVGPDVPLEDPVILTNNNDIEMPEYIVDLGTRTTYLKGKFLGKGGFARVHELTDLTTNRVYAGKIIAKSHITQPHHKEKIDREVDLHRTLCNPASNSHVVKFQHYFEDELSVYIILENCPKKSLVHVMKQRTNLTEPEVRYYMQQLVDGVSYIHSKNVIHRDLKLGNMFLTDEMIMKIGDFGLATRIDPKDSKKKATICGTPNYIAPEVLNKKGHGFQADIWAMGCIMYALLVGQPPFETATLKATYIKIMTNKYVIPPLISREARSLISALLHPNPGQRPNLDRITEHEFFSSGYFPSALSPACCSTVPKFPEFVAKLHDSISGYESLPSISPLQTQTLDHGVQKITRSMSHMKLRSHTSAESFKPSSQRKDKLPRNHSLKEMSKKEKDPSIHSAIRQKITSVLCPDRSFSHKKLKACTAANLYHVLNTCWENMPDGDVENPPGMNNSPIHFVVKWIDYSNKYGFGFQLSDGSVGVLFNDNTKIGFTPDKNRVEFIDLVGKLTVVSASSVPAQLQERHTLLRYFAQYMDENLTEGGDMRDVEWGKRKSPIPYMKRWLRTNLAIIMQLSTGTLQVNFFKDHTKIILSSEKSEYLVTFINEERHASTYRLLEITEMGCSYQIRERLLYALNVLKEFASLDGDGDEP